MSCSRTQHGGGTGWLGRNAHAWFSGLWVGVEAVRYRVCLECVSRVGLDSVVQEGDGWDGNGLDVEQ